MPYDKFYDQWVDATYDERGTLLVPSSTELTAASLDHIEDGIATAQATAENAVTENAGDVPATRQITAGTGLSGGGDLSTDRTLSVNFGTATGTVAQGNDSRIANAAQAGRQIAAGTGLTGGGDLTADRTLSVAYGALAGTAAQGNDARLSDSRQWTLYGGGTPTSGQVPTWNGTAYVPSTPSGTGSSGVPSTRLITAGTGLTGGGDLSVDRTLAVSYGTTAGTAAQGNDTRLSDARAWTLYAGGTPSSGQALLWNGTAYAPGTVSGGGTVSDATTTAKGIVQLAGDLGGTAAAPTVPRLADLAFNVKSYGAVGNGTTDDTAAINSAIAAALAAPGGRVWFPAGTYATTAVIDVPENVTLEGVHGDTIPYATSPASPCVIKPLGTHTGTAILRLRGKTETSRTYDHVGARIRNLTLDGTNTPAGTKGIQVAALVREARLEYVTVNAVKDTSFWFGAGTIATTTMPQSLRLVGCLAKASGNNGYTFTNVPDTTMIDCNSLGATNSGFVIQGFMNGQIANCRAEWSGQQGFYFTSGYWGSGQGNGGCNVLACSTDRNGFDGIRIDATGAGALQFTNCFNRRDGRNNGTGGNGYAGLNVMAACTMPVVVDNHQIEPGVDDDGTGTNSPQNGFLTANTAPVSLTSGYIWAATTALNVTATTVVSPMVGTATGLTTAPTRVAPLQTASKSQVDTASMGVYPLAEYGLVGASVHPDMCRAGGATFETTGRLGLVRLWVPANQAITGVVMVVANTVAATPTAGAPCRYLVYSDAGALLGSSADDTTLATTLGPRPAALSTPIAAQTTGRFVYAGIVHNYATTPAFLALNSNTAASLYWKIVGGTASTAANLRVQCPATGVTTAGAIPATFTPAAALDDIPVPFVGVY